MRPNEVTYTKMMRRTRPYYGADGTELIPLISGSGSEVIGYKAYSTFQNSSSMPSLQGYFGVNPANEEQAVERMQDAARSGMKVFVEPGTYGIDPTTPLIFDDDATVFAGAGGGLSIFQSVDATLTGNLINVRSGGHEIRDLSLVGDISATPNIDTLLSISASSGVVNNHFTATGLRLVGGSNGLSLARTTKAFISDLYGDSQDGHMLTFQLNALNDLHISNITARNITSEGISFSDFSNSVNAEAFNAGGRILLDNYLAYNCYQALDCYLTTTRLVHFSNILIDRCPQGGIEIKVKHDTDGSGNPNEGAQLIKIDNVTMRDNADGGSVGNPMVVLDWGDATPYGSNPGSIASKIEMHNLTCDYDSNVTSSSGCVLVEGQVDVAIDGLRVSGACSKMVHVTSGASAGAGAIGTRLSLSRLNSVGTSVIGGILVDADSFDTITLDSSRIEVTGHPIRFNTSYSKKVSIGGDVLLKSTASTGRAIYITSAVTELFVKGARLEGFDYGLYAGAFSSTPSAATLPNVSGVTISSTLFRVDFASAHGLTTGDAIYLASIGGSSDIPSANGTWLVTVIDSDTVDLQESSASTGTYSSGGTARRASKLTLDDVLFRGNANDAIRLDHDVYLQVTNSRANVLTTMKGVNNDTGTSKIRACILRGYLSAAPASTAGVVGDFFLNHTPAAAGAPGWVCTTTGSTSGAVWKAMASLAA